MSLSNEAAKIGKLAPKNVKAKQNKHEESKVFTIFRLGYGLPKEEFYF